MEEQTREQSGCTVNQSVVQTTTPLIGLCLAMENFLPFLLTSEKQLCPTSTTLS